MLDTRYSADTILNLQTHSEDRHWLGISAVLESDPFVLTVSRIVESRHNIQGEISWFTNDL